MLETSCITTFTYMRMSTDVRMLNEYCIGLQSGSEWGITQFIYMTFGKHYYINLSPQVGSGDGIQALENLINK